MRGHQSKLQFDTCGFKIMPFVSSMSRSDFLDPQKSKQVYLPEVCNQVKKELGASHVYVVDYTVRITYIHTRFAHYKFEVEPQTFPYQMVLELKTRRISRYIWLTLVCS